MMRISVGNPISSPEQRQPGNAGCHYQPSGIGQRFTKKPSYCKWVNLQECVLFCRPNLGIIKNQIFLAKSRVWPDNIIGLLCDRPFTEKYTF